MDHMLKAGHGTSLSTGTLIPHAFLLFCNWPLLLNNPDCAEVQQVFYNGARYRADCADTQQLNLEADCKSLLPKYTCQDCLHMGLKTHIRRVRPFRHVSTPASMICTAT